MLLPIKDTVVKYNLSAKKSLGQNFIYDETLLNRIVGASKGFDPSANTVIEVGPGPGGLSRAILDNGFPKLIVIEKDSRCLEALRELKDIYKERLEIMEDDALTIDWHRIVPEKSRIIANLPYNIGTELLLNWLRNVDLFSSFTLMFQKEVAERICSESGTKSYGRLSVLTNWLCETKIAFDVARHYFNPPPKVTSSVVLLKPRFSKFPASPKLVTLERLTAAAFSSRRKMLRSSLFKRVPEAETVFSRLDIDGTLRAENVPAECFIAAAKLLEDG